MAGVKPTVHLLLPLLTLCAAGCGKPGVVPGTSPDPAPVQTPVAAPPAPVVAAPAPLPATPPAVPKDAAAGTLVVGGPAGAIAAYTGVNMGPAPAGKATFDLTGVYQERGLNLIRTDDFNGSFELAPLEPLAPGAEPPAGTFDVTDKDEKLIFAGGFGIYLRLGNSYRTGVTQATNAQRLAAMITMFKHVQGAAGEAHRIQYVEVWNEPNNPHFWAETPASYYELYIAAAKAIRALDPKVKIGGPAVTPAGALLPRGRQFVADFLREVKAAGAPLDFLSWHMYANDPASFSAAAETYRKMSIDAGFGDLDQYVSEWNTSFRVPGDGPTERAPEGRGRAGGGGPRGGGGGGPRGERPPRGEAGGPGRRTEDGAAPDATAGDHAPPEDVHDTELRIGARASALTTAQWIAMQQSGVDQAFFYRGPDPQPYPSTFYGMFYADGAPKPAGWAAILWNRMMKHPTRLALGGTAAGPIWAIAGQNNAGEGAILLANATAQPQPWSVLGIPSGRTPHGARIVAPATSIEDVVAPATSGTLDPWEVRYLSW